MYKDFTCIILSGGKSSRMGTNKALLKIGDKTIIQIIIEKMKKLFEDVIVISNEPELYQFLEAKIYKDIYPGKGPISGIHSGLVNSSNERNFVISCDMPFIKKELIEYLISIETEKFIIVPKNKKYVQTLCGIYGKKCVPFIEEKILHEDDAQKKRTIDQKRFSLMRFVKEFEAEFVDVNQLPFYNDMMFFNINEREDLEKVKILIRTNDGKLL